MDRKLKKINLALYSCLFLLLVLSVTAIKGMFEKPQVLTSVERIREIRDDSISYWKDKYGQEHAQRIMATADLQLLKTAYAPLVDSVLNRLRINSKQLQEISAMGLSTQGRVHLDVDTVVIDSSRAYRFSYADRWLDLTGTIGVDNSMDYTTRDSLVITAYYKNNGFLGLGRRDTYIDAFSLNPHSHITGLQGLRISSQKPLRWSVGPLVGYGYNGMQWAPFFGVGLQYSILRF